MEEKQLKKANAICLLIIGIISLICAAIMFVLDPWYYSFPSGGNYSKILESITKSSYNIMELGSIIKFGFGFVLSIAGLLIILKGTIKMISLRYNNN